jgi:glycosyltransferase involved in cell wall biosynthesis
VAAPQVSVVLPTRNRSSMLRQALRSALDQAGVEVEVIVVDEASSDDTQAVLGKIGDERLTALRNEEPKGPAGARNAAVARARGEWIAFLDDDDVLAPGNFRAQLAGAAGSGAVLAYSGRVEVDEAMNAVHQSRPADPGGLATALLSNNPIGGPSGVLVRAEAFDRVGRFDEDFHALADWDLWVRVAAAGPAHATRDALLAYRRHEQNMMVTRVDEVNEEFVRLRQKYSDAAAEAGVEFGAAWLRRWTANREIAEGRRVAAARAYSRQALTDRNPRDFVRAAAALTGPRLQRIGESLEARATPQPEWLERYA